MSLFVPSLVVIEHFDHQIDLPDRAFRAGCWNYFLRLPPSGTTSSLPNPTGECITVPEFVVTA